MKFKATLHISYDKKSACYHISINDENNILQFRDKYLIMECIDMTPIVKLPVRLIIQKGKKYTKYLFRIPNRDVHIFTKKNIIKNQTILIKNL